MAKHEFGYPKVKEIMIKDLGPRLIDHTENQVDYYERQLESAKRDLAKVALLYSGQLQFEFILADA